MLGAERVDRREAAAGLQHDPGHRKHRLRMRLQELAQIGQPLRHPGPAIQQVAGLEQRSDVHRHVATEPGESLLLPGITEKIQGFRYADPRLGQQRPASLP